MVSFYDLLVEKEQNIKAMTKRVVDWDKIKQRKWTKARIFIEECKKNVGKIETVYQFMRGQDGTKERISKD